MRPVTLFTGQWADLPIEDMCEKASSFGFDGLELACWGDHFEVSRADQAYCDTKLALLKKYKLSVYAISAHLVGQAVCDRIDERHQKILPPYVWGDGDPEGVRQRAAEELIKTAEAAKRLGVSVVNGFTGSSIWPYIYSFPPVSDSMIKAGYDDFAKKFGPILDKFQELGVRFALEAHPTEIAFDIASAERALSAVGNHPAFGFNYDPSHLAYQGVDYVGFIRRFGDRIFHTHMKDVWWGHGDGTVGVFGGHVNFGDARRFWDFRSLGHGDIDFEEIIVALNDIVYPGPLSVEWEDGRMDREFGAQESCQFVRNIDFPPSKIIFDAQFAKK
jgi:sugar phosphate isomerase/epimerase